MIQLHLVQGIGSDDVSEQLIQFLDLLHGKHPLRNFSGQLTEFGL